MEEDEEDLGDGLGEVGDDEDRRKEVVGINGEEQVVCEKMNLKEENIRKSSDDQEKSRMDEEKSLEETCLRDNKLLEEKKREKMVDAELKKSRASYSIKLAQQVAKETEEQRRADALPPRAGGVIKVAFNKREFKHPARESKKEEEEEWLRRQAKAKAAKKKLEEEEGSMEYEEVVRKAGSFYQVGDLGSALEVLNQGLRLFPESGALWSKRTTVKISLEEWEPALEDSEIALRLLQPEVCHPHSYHLHPLTILLS